MPEALKKLIDVLSFLPGVGEKTATKLALFIFRSHPAFAKNFSGTLERLHRELRECTNCHAITDHEGGICPICVNAKRRTGIICVVEEYLDLLAIERLHVFDGQYHVLGGAISPINGVSPENLHIRSLLARVEREEVTEIILATNANIEGEATALYITENLPKKDIRVSRLSKGLPNAGYIEYADEITLLHAFRGRG